MRGWLLATVALCLGLALAASVRVDDMHLKRGLAHDEAISYLAAAGHEDDFARAANGTLAGRWVMAAQWKQMMVPNGFWGFAQVTAGLNHTDNHPPLYFWALRVWVWLLGLHLWSGPLLNLAIALCTTLAVFALGRRVVKDPRFAALGAAVWACSYPVVVTSRMARQYDLLALLTVLFALVVLRLVDEDTDTGVGDLIALAFLTGALFLTHYETVVFIAGSAVLIGIMMYRDRRRLTITLGALGAGVLFAVVLNPRFYTSFVSQRAQAHGATVRLVEQRMDTVRLAVQSFFHYAIPGPATDLWSRGDAHAGRVLCIVVLLALLGLAAALALPGTRERVQRVLARIPKRTWGFLALVGLAVATTLVPYVLFQVPVFAMGGRYLAMLWPLLAVVTMLALKSMGRAGLVVAVGLALWVMLPAAYLVARPTTDATRLAPFPSDVHQLVVNTVARGRLLPVLWRVPDTVSVFADRPDGLLAKPDAWWSELSPGAYYASVYAPRTSEPDWRKPFLLLRSRHGLADRGITMWWAKGSLWEVLK